MNDEILNNTRDKYLKNENTYKKHFEKYLSSKIDLKKYEDTINNTELAFGHLEEKIELKSKLDEYLNLNHFYILNSFYIEKLTNEEINILNYGTEEEIEELIERTYKDIIKYGNDRFIINYSNSTSNAYHAYNDELVIAIYYGSNTVKYGSKEKYLENYRLKKEFLDELSKRLSKEIKDILKIDSKIIYEKI